MSKIDWKRILRTFLQSACGAAAALISAIAASGFNQEALITASLQFGVTVITAVLMNLKTQIEELPEIEPDRKVFINWERILRTTLQAACGAFVAVMNNVISDLGNFSWVEVLLQMGITIGTAVLMNIQVQMNEKEK